jgi:hypothetical protein
MTITIDISPDVEARLRRAAQRAGLDMHVYVGNLLADEAPLFPPDTTQDRDEWESDLDELAAGSEDQPVLPPEAFSRESIYSDHD